MDITDFLPKYPNIKESKYKVLNAYEENFYEAIFRKKEFYDNRLSETVEKRPTEPGMLTKYQTTIARYFSSNTPYDRLLLVHGMGSGKTCSAIGAIEQIRNEDSNFTGALILAKGTNVLNNFIKELVHRCTAGQYIPENYKKLTELEKTHRIKKKTEFYSTNTFNKFAKKIKALPDDDVIETFSNKFIVVDEVHNLRIQKENKKETLEIYNQFHRFFHLVKNCKILLLSGTPMKDTPDELANVLNLILTEKEQLPTGKNFLEEYMEVKINKEAKLDQEEYVKERGVIYKLKKEKADELKKKLVGKISFLRMESNVKKEFIGTKVGKLEHFIVSPGIMSDFQTNIYKNAPFNSKDVYLERREASLFVFPDGSYGNKGFDKYIEKISTNKGNQIKNSFKMKQELYNKLKGSTNKETLNNIRKYSVTYANVIEKILETKGNCFIYCLLVQGGGCILFSLLLELFGFSKANGKETTPGLRFGLLTSETSSSKDVTRINDRYNKKDNVNGEFIKVIIGSKTISESFSLKNVIFEAIVTPWWNYSEIDQAIARGIRIGSHEDLKDPTVQIMQCVAIPNDNKTISVDLYMYETSEDKEISIRSIMRLLMEIAFDCGLNYLRNRLNGKTGSRECDYTTCNYSCFDIDMDMVKNGLQQDELDYSTYQLYYSNPKTPVIRKKIEQIFRKNYKTDLQSIIKNLKEENFTEEEIFNSLYIIQEEYKSGEFDYKNFLRIYSRDPVKKIINEIENLFRTKFILNFEEISTHFSDYTNFEVLTALQNIINDNIIITNKYGLIAYLREEKNNYFLVNSLSVESDFYAEYYNKFPYIKTTKTYKDVENDLYSTSLPKLINKICKTKNQKDFTNLIKSLPFKVQEIFIESTIICKDKGIKNDIIDNVLKIFEGYIKQIKNKWISTFLIAPGHEGSIRCKDITPNSKWENCDEKYIELIKEKEQERTENLRKDNPYGIIGKYNPENNTFCLVDFQQEKQEKRKSSDVNDSRRISTGKKCNSWLLKNLIYIGSERLKIEPPEDFRNEDTRQELLDRFIQSKSQSYNLYDIFKIKENELKKLPTEHIKRMLYWGTPTNEGGIRKNKNICGILKDWLESKGLLEKDTQCGVQSKTKANTIGKIPKTKETGFTILSLVPTEQEQEFKSYSKQISTIMENCGKTKYKPEINDNQWIIVFSKKKIVGFLTIDKNNLLSNVCIAKNYRRKDLHVQAMSQANKYLYETLGKTPTFPINKRLTNYNTLIRLYKSFGFVINKEDNLFSYMTHSSIL